MRYIIFFAFILLLSGCSADAQSTLTSSEGKSIPVTVVPGSDVTIAPIKKELSNQHYGYIQLGASVYPVYCSNKNLERSLDGSMFIIPTSCSGYEFPHSYLTKAQKKLIVPK